ncbi:MAG: N-acetylmuramic acid 6-phosphate etherase [Chlorobiales bacterium]
MKLPKPPKLYQEISSLLTEQVNYNTRRIDECTPLEIARLINEEDKKVAYAVEQELPQIAKAIELVAKALKSGGRLIYIGAGTSGRLGILDASECPPTFGAKPSQVKGIIAGGRKAVFKSVEGAEDDALAVSRDLEKIKFSKRDVLCGISASKRTPFVVGALKYARELGAKTIFLTSNPTVKEKATVVIRTLVGAEVIMGSTRMKAGTSHKMVLNMISTGAMILCGKTYGNLMIDLQQTNQKLIERTKRIFTLATGDDYATAEAFLKKAGGKLKTAIVMRLANVSKKEAEARLKKADGFVKRAIALGEMPPKK